MKYIALLLLLSFSPHTYVFNVTRGVVLYTYAKDVYGSYAPYRKTLYTNNGSFDFFESTDELNISYAATCNAKEQDNLTRLINADYKQRGIANYEAIKKWYKKKSTDIGSVDYTIFSDHIYNKLNEDTLYIAFTFTGTVLKMDAPECENFLMIMHSCMVPARPLSYPITFLYRASELSEAPKAFLDQLQLHKSLRHEIKVSYCQ